MPALQVAPATNIVASGPQGGPFSPTSFSYTLSATSGSVSYSISGVPTWLTASATSGTASSGTTVTFTVNTNANSLAANTYTATITFTSGTGQSIQRDCDAHRQSAGAASHPRHQHYRFGAAGRPILADVVQLFAQRHRAEA